jgi:hypothetical protein
MGCCRRNLNPPSARLRRAFHNSASAGTVCWRGVRARPMRLRWCTIPPSINRSLSSSTYFFLCGFPFYRPSSRWAENARFDLASLVFFLPHSSLTLAGEMGGRKNTSSPAVALALSDWLHRLGRGALGGVESSCVCPQRPSIRASRSHRAGTLSCMRLSGRIAFARSQPFSLSALA